MKDVIVDCLLGLAVVCAWIGAAGFARLASALDRLHAVAFANAAAGLSVAAAAFAADGLSTRSVKLACLVAFVLVTGSAISHAAGRALALRDGPGA